MNLKERLITNNMLPIVLIISIFLIAVFYIHREIEYKKKLQQDKEKLLNNLKSKKR
ncbi:MAG: hypothetical protein ACOCZ5_01075 [bacterium]